jgi:hypothetical protein
VLANKFESVKVVALAPTFVTEAKFVHVTPWHLKIEKPVSPDELSCHWSLREFDEAVLTVRLLGGLGTEGPAAADFAPSIVTN